MPPERRSPRSQTPRPCARRRRPPRMGGRAPSRARSLSETCARILTRDLRLRFRLSGVAVAAPSVDSRHMADLVIIGAVALGAIAGWRKGFVLPLIALGGALLSIASLYAGPLSGIVPTGRSEEHTSEL